MSVLKRKSSIALIIGTIVILLIIPLWYTMLAPSLIISELEKIDTKTSFEGTLYYLDYGHLFPELQISIEAHVYAKEVKGDNVTLRMDVVMTNTTDPDNPNKLEDFSYNKTYVFDKFTLENVKDAPESDNPNRTGYDPLYPMHLKAGEDIDNAWLENLNTTATLQFKGSVQKEGATLYKYFAKLTIPRKELTLPDIGLRNVTLTSSKTILIEPLSGLQAYTENEDLTVYMLREPYEPLKLLDLTYKTTAEAETQGIADAKAAHDSLQLAELYLPSIFGVVAVILIVGLAFNLRRLRKKESA